MAMNQNNQGLNHLIEASLNASAAAEMQTHTRTHDDIMKDNNSRKKALSSKLALEIFAERCLKSGYATVESTFVARKYGVSSKTVRDIWNRRTWADATRPMWTEEEKGSTEALEACKEKKRLANKKRKLSQMKQASDKEEATHDSDAHEDSKDMAEDEDEEGGSMHEGCSGSEASTQCERTSGKVLSSPAESGDVSNCKGSGSNSFPEGSSSPTSSFQSQSTSSSDSGHPSNRFNQFFEIAVLLKKFTEQQQVILEQQQMILNRTNQMVSQLPLIADPRSSHGEQGMQGQLMGQSGPLQLGGMPLLASSGLGQLLAGGQAGSQGQVVGGAEGGYQQAMGGAQGGFQQGRQGQQLNSGMHDEINQSLLFQFCAQLSASVSSMNQQQHRF